MEEQNPAILVPLTAAMVAGRPQRDYDYDIVQAGHFGACSRLAAAGFAPSELYAGQWANIHNGLVGHYKDILTAYWQNMINQLEAGVQENKIHQLPLARIKKVMKADPEVKMISAEAPVLFAKGCDIFITELTIRAWIHAEESKRRTLQRSDIAAALSKSDMFDFLIDIVPREDANGQSKRSAAGVTAAAAVAASQTAVGNGTADGPQLSGPAHSDFHLTGGIGSEQDYRQTPTLYAGQVQPSQAAAYSQAPSAIYGEIDGIYHQYSIPAQPPMPSENAADKHDPTGW